MRKYLLLIKQEGTNEKPKTGAWYEDKVGCVYIAQSPYNNNANSHDIDGVRFIPKENAVVISKTYSTTDRYGKPKEHLLICDHKRISEDMSRCYYCENGLTNTELLQKVLYKDVYLQYKK